VSWVGRVLLAGLGRRFGRRRPIGLEPPPPLPPGTVRRAEQAADHAAEVLDRVERQDDQVRKVSARADRILRENNLGPRFWAALGDRRR